MVHKQYNTFELIDKKMAEKLKKVDDGSFLAEIVGIFQSQTPGYVAQIEKNLAKGDYDEVRKQLHKIRGGCGTLGALLLMNELERIGENLKKGEKAAPEVASYISDLVGQTMEAMKKVYLEA